VSTIIFAFSSWPYRTAFTEAIISSSDLASVLIFEFWTVALERLRDIITCLGAHEHKLYHIVLSHGVSRSTLADANEQRDWRINADFA